MILTQIVTVSWKIFGLLQVSFGQYPSNFEILNTQHVFSRSLNQLRSSPQDLPSERRSMVPQYSLQRPNPTSSVAYLRMLSGLGMVNLFPMVFCNNSRTPSRTSSSDSRSKVLQDSPEYHKHNMRSWCITG